MAQLTEHGAWVQIGNAGVQYNDPQEDPVPQQKAGSNFPGEGVRPSLYFCTCSIMAPASVLVPSCHRDIASFISRSTTVLSP